MKKSLIILIISLLSTFTLNAQLITEYAYPVALDSLVKQLFGGYGVEITNVQFAGYHISYLPQPSPIHDIGKFTACDVNLGIDS